MSLMTVTFIFLCDQTESCVTKWHARLHVYRSPVLFLWEALVFRSPILHGVVVWLCANLLVL